MESSALVELRMALDNADAMIPGICSRLLGSLIDSMAANEVVAKEALQHAEHADSLFTAAKKTSDNNVAVNPTVDFLYQRWVKQNETRC